MWWWGKKSEALARRNTQMEDGGVLIEVEMISVCLYEAREEQEGSLRVVINIE